MFLAFYNIQISSHSLRTDLNTKRRFQQNTRGEDCNVYVEKGVMVLAVVSSCCFPGFLDGVWWHVMAEEEADTRPEKYYTSIHLKDGDTLWKALLRHIVQIFGGQLKSMYGSCARWTVFRMTILTQGITWPFVIINKSLPFTYTYTQPITETESNL